MAERHPREQALRRVHGTGALFSAAYGNVGSSIYYALGLVALYALGLTPVTFIISGIIFAFTAASYVEATVLYPEAGGSSSFARYAFNEAASFFAAWAQMLTYIVTVAISAYFVPHYLAVFWEPLASAPADLIFGIGVIAVLAYVNVRGSEESARLNFVLVIADLLTQIALVGIGLAIVFKPELLVSQVDFGSVPTWGNFALGIAVGMVAFTGIETISNMSEEARSSWKTIPRGTGAVVLTVVVLYTLLPLIALSAMPVIAGPGGEPTTALATTYAESPMLGIVDNLGLAGGLQPVAGIYVGLLAGVILLAATNAALIGLSRLTFSMGQHRQLPEILRQVHPRYKTPHVAIVFFSAVATIVILSGEATFLAAIYAFGATLSFTVAHVSVIRLRKLHPLEERRTDPDGKPLWHSPFNVRLFGVQIPVLAVIGGAGTAGAFIVAMALDPVILATGGGWMVLGTVFYVVYRRRQGLPLTETVKVASLTPLGVEEVEYKSVLVVFEPGQPFSDEHIATAKALAAPGRRAIHVISLIEVPTYMGLDEPMDDQVRIARRKIERAKLAAGVRVTGQIQRVRPGGEAKAIIVKAKKLNAAAIVMRLRHRNGNPLYNKTLQTVLAKRPCWVIVSTSPDERPDAVHPVKGSLPSIDAPAEPVTP